MKTIVVFLLLLIFCSLAWAGDPNYLRHDRVIRFTYAYGSEEPIPGTSGLHRLPAHCLKKGPVLVPFGPDFTEHDAVGVSYSYFLQDEVAIEVQASLPLGVPGAENLGLSVAGDYYFGRVYLPLQLGYRGDLDALYVASGVGVDWVLPNDRMNLRLTALAEYLDADEDWAWVSQAAVGWRF